MVEDESSKPLTVMLSALNWVYNQTIEGIPGTDSVQELVDDYLRGEVDLEDAIDSLADREGQHSRLRDKLRRDHNATCCHTGQPRRCALHSDADDRGYRDDLGL